MSTTPPTDASRTKDKVDPSDAGPSHRPRLRMAAAAAGVTVAGDVAVTVSASPMVAFINNQHNETLVRSPGRP